MAGSAARARARGCGERGVRFLIYSEDLPSADDRVERHTGIGRYCAGLVEGLATAGHYVRVVSPRTAGSPVRAAALVREVRAARPDVLLVGDPVAHRVAALVVPLLRIPYCPILYGTEILRLGKASRRNERSWLQRARLALQRWYLTRAHERIAISRFTAAQLHAAIGATSVVIPPAVTTHFLTQPVLDRRRDGPIRLLTVGRISERKNQLGVLRYLARLQGAALDVRYTLLGNVDHVSHQSYAQALRAFIAKHNLGGVVSILERASEEQKLAAMDDCDVVVALSRTVGPSIEGFGITAIEAGARARPAIVSTEGGMKEAIEPGKTGLAIDPEDETAFGAGLRLMTDDTTRTRMGAAARALVESVFTTHRTARMLVELLQETLWKRIRT
jgi:glycosyltransferase involved in cell wall biosynthesis